MQTLDRTQDLAFVDSEPPRHKRRWIAFAAGGVAIAVVAAGVAYAAGSGRTTTKTIVKTVAPPPVQTPVTIDDRGFSKLDNGHQAEQNVFEQPMDAATRATLENQLTLARQAAMQYPTVKDAEAAGWKRAGPFAPGLGAHYFHWSDVGRTMLPAGKIDATTALLPASLIYDGTQPNSRIAGLMYYSLSSRIPQGFAGTNDIWHYHTNVCIVYGAGGTVDTPYGADTTVTSAMCNAVHGTLLAKTQWMLHAWVVPGYDSPEGVFSHLNEAITCRDGSYKVIPLDKIGNRSSVCVDGGE